MPRRRSLLLGALSVGLSGRSGGEAPGRSRRVGINLAGLAYWTTQFPFADLMKNGSGWSSRSADGRSVGDIVLHAQGYPAALAPGQRARQAVAWDDSRYSRGRYIARWDGEGELAFPGHEHRVVERGRRRVVLDIDDGRLPILVEIVRTDPGNPIRSLRFLWPGTDEASTAEVPPFTPEFLARLAPFRALRFMDWGATNGSPVARWSDRAKPGDPTYTTERGVPLEAMIELANKLQADPWFCIPHLADDDYVRSFAGLLKARLDRRLTATIEYSNEVWNGAFAQARWALAQSARLGLPASTGQAGAFYAERVLRIVAICAEVFGAAERRRWSPIVAGQAAWRQFGSDALAWKDTAAKVDALAIAPYFRAGAAGDPARAAATAALDGPAVIEQMLGDIRGMPAGLIENVKLARRHRLPLIAYEGGAHDSSSHFPAERQEAVAALFMAAHRHPRMRQVYREYLDTWFAAGGGLFMHYNDIGRWSKWGLWSLLEHVTQDPATAPKLQGVLDAIAAHPPPPR